MSATVDFVGSSDASVHGEVVFTQDTDSTTDCVLASTCASTQIHISLWGLEHGALSWKLHDAPVTALSSCAQVAASPVLGSSSSSISPDAAIDTQKTSSSSFGDLNSRTGHSLNVIDADDTSHHFNTGADGLDPYEATFLPLIGPYSVLGRSLVLYKGTGEAFACGNVVDTTPALSTDYALLSTPVHRAHFGLAESECIGDDDGTGTGTACALNSDKSGCAVDGGDCTYASLSTFEPAIRARQSISWSPARGGLCTEEVPDRLISEPDSRDPTPYGVPCESHSNGNTWTAETGKCVVADATEDECGAQLNSGFGLFKGMAVAPRPMPGSWNAGECTLGHALGGVKDRSIASSAACGAVVREYEWIVSTGECLNPSGNVDSTYTTEAACEGVVPEWVGGAYTWDATAAQCHFTAATSDACTITARPDRRFVEVPGMTAGVCMQKRFVPATDEVSCTGSGVSGRATLQQTLSSARYGTTATVSMAVASGTTSLAYAWQASQLSCAASSQFALEALSASSLPGTTTAPLLRQASPAHAAALTDYNYGRSFVDGAGGDAQPASVSLIACEVDRAVTDNAAGRQWSGSVCQTAAGATVSGDLSEFACVCIRTTSVACGDISGSPSSTKTTAKARLSDSTSVILSQLSKQAPTTITAAGTALAAGKLYLHPAPVATQVRELSLSTFLWFHCVSF